jgi:branched-chain amino acid transport system permease protein
MVTVPNIKLVGFVLTLAIAGCLVVFLKSSRLGQAIRATAQNARAARILGIDTDRVYAATYALNAALCGAAGALVVMTWVIQPFQGLAYTVRSFMIVVVAGLGNLPGVIVSAFGLGAAENMAGFILGAEFQIAFVFGLLVVVLLVRSHRLKRQRRYLK